MVDQLITTAVGLGLLAGGYCLWLLTGIVNSVVNTHTWSWKKMATDISKALLMGVVIMGLVALANGLDWYAGLLGFDISTFTDGMSTVTMLGGIVAGIAVYYGRAMKNALNFFKLPSNNLPVGEQNYKAIAEPVKQLAIALFSGAEVEQEDTTVATGAVMKKIGQKAAAEVGAFPYYKVTVTTPKDFYNATIGKGFDEGFGLQAHTKGTYINGRFDGGRSYKKVEELKVGDTVLSTDGGLVPITAFWSAEHPIYRIRTSTGDYDYTPEHPLLACVNRDYHNPNRNNYNQPEYVKVENLKPTDRLVFKPAPTVDTGWGLTDDEAWIYGLWLGDGCAIDSTSHSTEYRITLGEKKMGKMRSRLETLQWISIRQHSNGKDYELHLKVSKMTDALHSALASSGKYSYGKQIVEGLTHQEAKSVLEGYITADGTERRENQFVCTSTSKPLLLGLQRYVWMLGGNMSIHLTRPAGIQYSIKGSVGVSSHDLYTASINLNPAYSVFKEIDGEFTAAIWSIELIDERDITYHFEVGGDHTYVAENMAVHNCVAFFKEFMFSLSGQYVAAGGAASNYASSPARENVCKLGFEWHNGADGLQDGDWGVWTNGSYGHVAMFFQGKWLGQNQAAANPSYGNEVNLTALPLTGLAGYFRPKIYKQEKPAPAPAPVEPQPKPSNKSITYTYKAGDTFGQVITDLGLKTSHGLWGPTGDVAYYNEQLHEQGIWGNIPIGTTIKLTPRE